MCSQGFKAVFDEDTSHMGCDAMFLAEYLPMFRSITLISFPRCQSNRNETVQIVPYFFCPDEGTRVAIHDFVSSTVQDCLIMKIKVLGSSETTGSSHPATLHHVLEGLPH